MITYNDNLRQTIVELLQQRGLGCDNASSQLMAAKTSLHYAEKAAIDISDMQKQQLAELKTHTTLVQQTTSAKHLSDNESQGATMAMQCTKQGVTNAAGCAANIQLAANSILRLASDVGSAWSIVNTADVNSDISKLASEARDLMNAVANDAELASRLGMELSIQTAEISTTPLAERSKAAGDILATLYGAAMQSKNTLAQKIAEKEAALTEALEEQDTAKRLADAATLQVQVANANYAHACKALNQDLKAMPIGDDIIRLSFRPVTDPFAKADPVQSQYAIIVKQSQQYAFSIADAESLLLPANYKQVVSIAAKTSDASITLDIRYKAITGKDGHVYKLQDNDGDDITPGIAYAAFVITVYTDDYKKKLNCYDDWLSAPSPAFTITTVEGDVPRKGGKALLNSPAGEKQAEIVVLRLHAEKARREVDEAQAGVDELTARLARYQQLLSDADARRAAALGNKTLCDELAQAVTALLQDSSIALDEAKKANKTAQQLAIKIKAMVDKLIYTADTINKLANFIVRKKALNPLISDELIRMITAAGNDANNSVALSLVALQSVFNTEASNGAASGQIAAAHTLATALHMAVVEEGSKNPQRSPLQKLFRELYEDANASYQSVLQANVSATKELNDATVGLNNLKAELTSLQAGLAAANAAIATS